MFDATVFVLSKACVLSLMRRLDHSIGREIRNGEKEKLEL